MLADAQNAVSARNPVMRMTPDADRRKDRRRSFDGQDLIVEQVNAKNHRASKIGTLLDMSTSGVRFRSSESAIAVGSILQIRLTLPSSTGISPFLARKGNPSPATQWTGWVTVTRIVHRIDGTREIAGSMLGMDETELGMLGLYLSTQPLAA